MKREAEPMREIHKIREQLHKEEKNLTHEERIAKVHKESEELIKKYRIKFKRRSHAA